MGKKFSVVLQKPKCLKCGRRLQIDRSETNYNAGKITIKQHCEMIADTKKLL